jgi:hypothetical protein
MKRGCPREWNMADCCSMARKIMELGVRGETKKRTPKNQDNMLFNPIPPFLH